jgi:LuxR family transcriptional regulator, maltose regulon positive regulatory protein
MNEAFKLGSAPIVPAKLTRPRTHGVLPRERLFHSISVAREKKVIWISGPAGSGKTTLAASYLESQKGPCLWYQVDEGDDDLATFFYYLGLAAKIVAPRNRKILPLFTPEYFLGIPVFAKRYFELLTERLMGRARRRFSASKGIPIIVFDNYQDIPEASLFHMVINASLDTIPQGMNVFILSRSEPPPTFAGRRDDGQIHLIDWKDIRLTREESNAIALIKAGREIPDATLTQLYQTTDGWAAGIVLLIESMRIKDYVYQRTRYLPQEDIFAYFATELFDRISHEKRTFLIETAFLPTMNTRTAKELTGNIRADQIFSDLNRKNYFTYRYDSFEQTFQYHPLFREFLKAKAAETLDPRST